MKPGTQDALAHIMKSLGNPVRVEILQQLTVPRQLGEIQVSPARKEKGDAPRRRMTRASVQGHLEQLMAVGAVRTVAGVRDGRTVTLYTIDQRQLFALTEELRDLGRLRGDDAVADGTAPAPPPAAVHEGPRLVLMNGPFEGRVVPLAGAGPWSIGRSADSTVCLSYDPFLSTNNSEVRAHGSGYQVVDLPHARNGTALNWTTLPRGQAAPLVSGDVVGVGRTLLLFRKA